jgi:hypothetical protein
MVIEENIQYFRIILLALLVVAIIGPWTYDLIHVPAEYPCSAPFVRLEGDFCGAPALAITSVFGVVAGMPLIAWEFLTGGMGLASLTSMVFPLTLIFLLVLPFLTTLLLFRNQDSRSRRLFHIVGLTLVAGLGWFILTTGGSGIRRFLWGMWLYYGLVTLALILELLAFNQRNDL